MQSQNTPYEVSYESSPMDLRQLCDKLFSRKNQLEGRGYNCPWLLENIGTEQPLLLTAAERCDDLVMHSKHLGEAYSLEVWKDYDKKLRFGVRVTYVPSKKEAYCYGSNEDIMRDAKLYDLVQSAIKEFRDLTKIDLHIPETI